MNTSGSKVVKAGSSVSLFCAVYGFPLSNKTLLHWSFHSHRIENSSSQIISDNYTNPTTKISTLDLFSVNKKHNGTYSCHFDDLTSEIELRVLSKASGLFLLLLFYSVIFKKFLKSGFQTKKNN